MENESIFKRQPRLNIQNFTKYFYPNMAEGVQDDRRKKHVEDGVSEGEDDDFERERENMPETLSKLQNPSLAGGGGSTVFLGMEGMSSCSVNTKSRLFKQRLTKMENLIKTKLH